MAKPSTVKRPASTMVCLVIAAAMATMTAAPRAARADEPAVSDADAELARTHFKEGLELEKAGDFSSALQKFRLVAAVKKTAQVRFHIALCEEKTGKLVAALADYDAARDAAEAGNVPEVLEAAPKLAAGVRARVAWLSVTFPSGARPDQVRLDGVKLLPDQLDAPIMIDPGDHVLIGGNEGAPETRLEFSVGEGETHPAALTAALSPEEPVIPLKKEAPTPAAPAPSDDRRTVGYAIGGFGVAALAASAVFYGVRISAVNDLDAQCVDMRCPGSAQTSLDKAHTFTTLSRIALGVSVATLGVGAYLLLTGRDAAPASGSPKSGSAPVRVGFVPYAPGSLVGAGMEGAF